MAQKSGSVMEPAKQAVKEIRRATRRQFSAEERIRIVLTGPRGEDSIAGCVGAKESFRTSITAGRRNFWKLARNAGPATPHGRRSRTRSRICVGHRRCH
jgi:hypothetical protein